MKILKEWFIKAPWGNIALASCGNPQGEPVLLVHGRLDSLSTFVPLLQILPARYYYVAMDLPGNGKSDAFPIGVMVARLLQVSVIDIVIRHLKWKRFVYIGHSIGGELGLFYNVIWPGKVLKFIFLDVKPGFQHLQITDVPHYFKSFYAKYYNDYAIYCIDDRKYTKEEALQAVMRARRMTREQAELVLERNLKEIGNNKYKLSWDRRQTFLAPINFPPELYIEIFSKNTRPSLYLNFTKTHDKFYVQGKDAVNKICAALEKNGDVWMMDVDGNHNVHFTHPERLDREICAFLDKNLDTKSKL